MKKAISKTTIILLLIIGILAPNIVGAWTDNANGAWKTAYAYQFTIIKYDGSGDIQVVGKPILIYHPDLFQDVYITTSTPLPKSYNSFVSHDWGFTQMIDPFLEYSAEDYFWAESIEQLQKMVEDKIIDDSNEAEDGTFSSIEDYKIAKDMIEDKNLKDTKMIYDMMEQKVVTGDFNQRYVDVNYGSMNFSVGFTNTKSPISGKMDWDEYTYRFLTKQKRITYKGSEVGTQQYYKIYKDAQLTENKIKNGYLDTLARKYAGGVGQIKQYFNIDIDYNDIDKYYLRVEPVQRVLDKITKEYGHYFIDSVSKVLRNPDSWDESDWHFVTGIDCWEGENLDSYYVYSGKISDSACDKDDETQKNGFTYNGKCYSDRDEKCKAYWLGLQQTGVKIIKEMYGRYAYGASHLESSCKLNSGAVYKERALDRCNESKNMHCELKSDNKTCKRDQNGNIIYQYYIGPDLQKGITGNTKNNKYKLVGDCYSGKGTTCFKHYYIPDILTCPEVCAKAGSNTGDEFLKCAENYCEAEINYDRYDKFQGSAQKAKEGCILTCGYKGKETNCETANLYKNTNENYLKNTSSCTFDNSGVIKTCVGDKINSFDGDDTNDTAFDTRKYISIDCSENSKFDYKDTSDLVLSGGEALDYFVKLDGTKRCQAYFEYDQWKFDYATISAKDPDRRKRLNYIKEVFNNALNSSYNNKKSKYYDADFESEGDGEIPWSDFFYDYNKVSVHGNVVENIFKKATQSQLEEFEPLDIVNKAPKNVIDNHDVKKIANNKIVIETVNKYEQVSTSNVTYKFNKRCVSIDGFASVVRAGDNDICYYEKNNNNINTPIKALNVYYTNINIDDGIHNVHAYATVGRNNKIDELYYDNSAVCSFNVGNSEPSTPSLSCDIETTAIDPTQNLGNNIFEGGKVLATIVPQNHLSHDDFISSYTLTIRGTSYDGKSREIGISDKKLGMETIKILGVVRSAKGIQAQCPKIIHIIDNHDNCGVKCALNKKTETLYEIKSTGVQDPVAYYRKISIDLTKRRVYKSVVDQKYYISLDSNLSLPEKANLILFGIVEGTMKNSSEKCEFVCHTPAKDMPNCLKLYKPAQTVEIKKYCDQNYSIDINGYSDAAECKRLCGESKKCDEEIRHDLTKVQAFCRTNYNISGFANERSCVNTCYDETKGKYIYRTINNYNPFPNSYDSEAPYDKGKRVVGDNWVGFTDYIKHDDDDVTSITGVYSNQHVEYIIDLTPDDINKIRENNKSAIRDGYEPYVEYIPTKSNKDKKYAQSYESKFIHEDFEDLFRKDLT